MKNPIYLLILVLLVAGCGKSSSDSVDQTPTPDRPSESSPLSLSSGSVTVVPTTTYKESEISTSVVISNPNSQVTTVSSTSVSLTLHYSQLELQPDGVTLISVAKSKFLGALSYPNPTVNPGANIFPATFVYESPTIPSGAGEYNYYNSLPPHGIIEEVLGWELTYSFSSAAQGTVQEVNQVNPGGDGILPVGSGYTKITWSNN
jgi:hypothetical protein